MDRSTASTMADDEGPKKNSADGEFESSAFEALERDFQEVLQELVGDKSLERFRAEYEKLHRALKKSHEQEKRLIKRCRELNAEIVNNAAKVQTALKLSQEDQHTITSLKKEIEKAWKMVDASHEKEVRAKETIQKLKMEIANLSRLVEQGAGLSIGQDNTVQELINLRDDLKKQVEDQSGSIKQLKEHMNTLNGRVVQLEGEKDEQKHQIKELNDLVTQREAEQERDRRRKKRLDEELKDLKGQLEVRHRSLEWVGGVGGGCFGVGWVLGGAQEHLFWPQACASNDEDSLFFVFLLSLIHQVRLQEIGSQNRQVDTQKDKIRRLETQLKEARGTMEKQVQAMDTLFGKTQKLAEDLDTQMIANDGVTKELHRMQGTLLSEIFSFFFFHHCPFSVQYIFGQFVWHTTFFLFLWQSLTPFPLRLLTGELKKKDTEIANLANDNNGIKRRVDKEKKKVVIMQQRVADAKQARDMVVVELTQTQKDLEVARRREDGLSKNIESLNGRLEVKDRAVAREVDKTKAQSDLVVMEQRKVKALEDGKKRLAKEARVYPCLVQEPP